MRCHNSSTISMTVAVGIRSLPRRKKAVPEVFGSHTVEVVSPSYFCCKASMFQFVRFVDATDGH